MHSTTPQLLWGVVLDIGNYHCVHVHVDSKRVEMTQARSEGVSANSKPDIKGLPARQIVAALRWAELKPAQTSIPET